MIEGPRGKTSPPSWDTPLTAIIREQSVLAACQKAGFVLLRDVARFSAVQLVKDYGFTEDDTRSLHERFEETDHAEGIQFGEDFIGLARMYITDALGKGEGNPAF
jgi:hypothetical protein